jgi:hypothetical protein
MLADFAGGMSVPGQTEKTSAGADVFRTSADNGHHQRGVRRGSVECGRGFPSKSNIMLCKSQIIQIIEAKINAFGG